MRKALIRFFALTRGAVGDLLAEVIALAEHLAGDAHDFLGVVVVLGEDQRLGRLVAAGEQLGQAVLVGCQDGADLVGRSPCGPAPPGRRRNLPPTAPSAAGGCACPPSHPPALLDGAALLGDARADAVHLPVHVDAVRHGALAGVLHHQVLVEKTEGLLAGGGGQADQVGVEIFQHLPPQVVDRAVALVGDDEIVILQRQARVVAHIFLRLPCQRRRPLPTAKPLRSPGRTPPRPRAWSTAAGWW